MKINIKQEFQNGVAAHREGKLQKAEHFYRSILRSKPTHPDANHNMGVLLSSIGNFKEALPFYQNAISIDKKKEQYWVNFISTLIKLGKIVHARKIISEAISLNVRGDKIISLNAKLNPSTKLDFFYNFFEKYFLKITPTTV